VFARQALYYLSHILSPHCGISVLFMKVGGSAEPDKLVISTGGEVTWEQLYKADQNGPDGQP
jgi:hypothetical protein